MKPLPDVRASNSQRADHLADTFCTEVVQHFRQLCHHAHRCCRIIKVHGAELHRPGAGAWASGGPRGWEQGPGQPRARRILARSERGIEIGERLEPYHLAAPTFELRRQLALLNRCADEGANILCTQELFTTQYFCQTEDHRFFELAERELRRSQRDHSSLVVCMVDIDLFKSLNDRHGHAVGDLALTTVAGCCQSVLRETDIIGRYGGEEFVLLLPHAAFPDTFERADAWRQDYSETPIHYEGVDFFTTFSPGVASYPDHGITDHAILQAADKALYHSKNSGRNMVTLYNREI